MDTETILSAAGLILAIAALVVTTVRLVRKKSAEQKLVELLHLRIQSEPRLRRANAQIRDVADIDESALKLYADYIEAATQSLSESQRRQISEALHQSSLSGRRRYVRKIISEAQSA